MTQKYQTGMTLLELMITVAIVGILAAIAYPSYRESIIKSNRTEAKVALSRIASDLEKCFTLNGAYNSTTGNCNTLKTNLESTSGIPSEGGRYIVRAVAGVGGALNTLSYTLVAIPQAAQSADATCANFILTDTNVRNVSGTGTAATCWR